MKKNLLSDLDGSFLGSPGHVISQSEFGWGSQQRGLGDFRIPKEMLAAPNGSMIDPSQIYSNPGIVRDQNLCTYRPDWQAYECHGIEYRMLIIESMDNDTESRRLSPVAILSDNGYLDLINGPQDHGWCFGYTCQKRLSTFMALIAANKSYDIFLTSTPPDKLRFRILNADSTFKVRLSMYYFTCQRIDLYKNGQFMAPTNAEFVNGNMLIKDPSANLNYYKPTYQNASGVNLFYKNDSKMYFAIDGTSVIDLKIAPVLYVTFGLPAVTPEAFFNPATIVGNFALLLGVDASKIRRVSITRASKKKRSASGLISISITIEDNANTALNDTATEDANKQAFSQLGAQITNQFVTGQLQQRAQDTLNITIAGMAIQQPQSNSSATSLAKIDTIKVITQASGCAAQIPCSVQPVVAIVDENVI